MNPNFEIEKSYQNFIVVGVDEVGRGCLAGPVVASLVYLEDDFLQSELKNEINDSKKISPKKRNQIFIKLKEVVKFGVGIVDNNIIDEINILEASKLAMLNAYKDFVKKYNLFPNIILVDGNFIPFKKIDEILQIKSIIKGDEKSLSIATASIIAKEIRDEIMRNFHIQYPLFSFNKNKGYLTKFHAESIERYGICKIHRKSFDPIKSMINQ